jgi:putative peptide zinc metalloprotease protein
VDDAATDLLWQRMAGLQPQLRASVLLFPHDYRGERWYVAQDESSGRFLRFNRAAYELLGRFDGDLTLEEVWERARASLGDAAPTRDEAVQILVQLHGAELLRSGLPGSTQEALLRFHEIRRQRRRSFTNPLAIRIPLFDPDQLLSRLAPLVRPLFSTFGRTLWLTVVGLAALLAVLHAGELMAAVAGMELSPRQVLLFWILYPVIKALHELGHGLAVKVRGGEVHEMGINLLVFMPLPYVDATASWGIRDKRRRALVAGAGVLVELFVAAVGLLVWLSVEPGWVSEAAINVALIGGVSTLLFNGNPLLRYDGYYVLEDLIEIPNLATRAARFYLYLIQRHAFGMTDARSPVTAAGERRWFAFYGLASPLYRLAVLTGIALYLADNFLVVGIALAAWTVGNGLLLPAIRGLRFVAASPRLGAHRLRAAAATTLVAAVVVGGLLVPVPLVTRAEGVVWLEDQALVYAAVDGFVAEVLAADGSGVNAGDPLVRLEDQELATRLEVLTARLAELRTQHAAERRESRVRAAMVTDDIAAVEAETEHVRALLAALIVRSPVSGRLVLPEADRLAGRFVKHGDRIGYLVDPRHTVVRAVIPQDRIGLLQTRPCRAEVKLADRLDEVATAQLVRVKPLGSDRLPSPALGVAGGGKIAVEPKDEKGLTAAERVFQVDLTLPDDVVPAGIGGRTYVRLDHGREPLWQQFARSAKQLLLRRLTS